MEQQKQCVCYSREPFHGLPTDFRAALLTDLYQLTMAQGYHASGLVDAQACFHMYFRYHPFQGGYAVACGMSQLAEIIDQFHFNSEDLEYLESVPASGGGRLFSAKFLQYLEGLRLSVDIDAVPEGTIVFPQEPLIRVKGSIAECQLIETALLNCVNFETLIATKAARIVLAAEAPVAEFGLRRAQGFSGGVWASRAAVVGGCASTSNVLAGKIFDLPVSGTHAHSWIMSFPDELSAMRAYAREFPQSCVLLVDTYDVDQGIRNAITIGLEMKERGERLQGIRIDSGDLAWIAKKARAMLDEAGLPYCGVVLSGDLDEYAIQSIRNQGATVSSWGVGTKLATAYEQPSLGGVYKLSAMRHDDGIWHDRIKITGSSSKTTVPGVLDVRRYYHENGCIAGDMVFDENTPINDFEIIVDPADRLRKKSLKGKRFKTLLEPLARGGGIVLPADYRNALAAHERAFEGLLELDESQRRLLNPHIYPVGLERNLFDRRSVLIARSCATV